MRSAALLIALLATPAAAQDRPAELHALPAPAGLGRLLLPPDGSRAALVLLLPDAIGDDGRAEPYAEALSARGIASLTLGLGADADSPTAPATDPASGAAAVPVALGWAAAARFDPARVALLGFGAGGRAALAMGEGRPVVALYPGCAGLAATTPALVMQGEEAPDAALCAALPGPISFRALPGLGHGWDAPGALWPSPGPLLPDPAGGPARIQARTDAAGAIEAAGIVASYIEAALNARQAVAR